MPPTIPSSQIAHCTQEELDRAVDKTVEDYLGDVSDISSKLHQHILLQAIIEYSNGGSDRKYIGLEETETLINTNEELQRMLASAWKRKSYSEIRRLVIPQISSEPRPPGPETEHGITDGLREKLSLSFQAKYQGLAVDGFYKYLTHNEWLFRTVENPQYYARFCSIVQSSGTGKSRVLMELRKKNVMVIYMNLRSEGDQLAFPMVDPDPSRILTTFPPTEEGYRFICYVFFIALFETLEERLSISHATGNDKTDIMDWVDEMCDMSDTLTGKSTARGDFFGEVARKYDKIHADAVSARSATTGASSTSDLDKPTDKLRKLSHSDANPDITERFFTSYSRMAASLERIFADDSNKPKLVIALDEAHPLSPVYNKAYRPANVFCRVVNQYSHFENHAVWVVFASTTSKVADFSSPHQKYKSDRVVGWGAKLFPPYTQLGWDQGASGLLKGNDIENIAQIDHIAGHGRPLWLSLKNVLTSPKGVLDTASNKLCGAGDFNPQEMNHVLAVLGQRFGLNISFGHPDAVQYLETGIASHLRICLATTPDCNWFTSYPSEPLLSCAATAALYKRPEKLDDALGTLLKAVSSGIIDMGERGELASRLLWLLAKDLFIRTQARNVVTEIPSTWDEHLTDCQMIPVVDWLEFVFGSQIWDKEDTQASLGRKMFENAYLNFSHWVSMDANIAGSYEGNELGLEEWTQRHLQRTSAVQCCHQQPLIDKVIPIYFKDGPVGSQMSQIFISDNARKSTNPKDVLRSITRRNKFLGGEGGLPYIVVLADLAQPESLSVTFPERNVDDRCLRIYAAGVNTTTYPFLARYPALVKTLQDLVLLQQMPKAEWPHRKYLNAQVKFGSTATPEHMRWENGRSCP